MSEVRVRFAPSPTGPLHIGGVRTALYNYLFAKNKGCKIILRIEDTDRVRKVENAVENLISTFNMLNIQFDEGPKNDVENESYFQSKRLDIYRKHIKILLDNCDAYPCFCSSERLEELRKQQAENKKTIKYNRYCLRLDPKEAIKKMLHPNMLFNLL